MEQDRERFSILFFLMSGLWGKEVVTSHSIWTVEQNIVPLQSVGIAAR
ncbi:hypothetical protein [Proteiniphilum sp.]